MFRIQVFQKSWYLCSAFLLQVTDIFKVIHLSSLWYGYTTKWQHVVMSNDILDWYVKYSSANLTVIQIMKRPESNPREMFNWRSYMRTCILLFTGLLVTICAASCAATLQASTMTVWLCPQPHNCPLEPYNCPAQSDTALRVGSWLSVGKALHWRSWWGTFATPLTPAPTTSTTSEGSIC